MLTLSVVLSRKVDCDPALVVTFLLLQSPVGTRHAACIRERKREREETVG